MLGNSNIFNQESFAREDLHKLLDNIEDSKKIDNLFQEISSLNIKETWQQLKLLVLAKQIYMADTTYGSQSSCPQGGWSRIIDSVNEISADIVEQYDQYVVEEEQKKEFQKNIVTEENIEPFVKSLANHLIDFVKKDNSKLWKALEDFAIAVVDINEPEGINLEQQKILAEINRYFSENIKKFLPNYDDDIPTNEEYIIIVNKLPEIGGNEEFDIRYKTIII